jgi:hypothetical protein
MPVVVKVVVTEAVAEAALPVMVAGVVATAKTLKWLALERLPAMQRTSFPLLEQSQNCTAVVVVVP